MKNYLLSMVLCFSAMLANAQQPDNSATVFISKLSIQWGFSPLPVTWVSFKGNLEQNKVVLTWQTAQESNSSHFEILRFSAENPMPVKIAEVGSRGNTTTLTNYVFTDNQPLTGTNYYQLRQVDLDRKFALSSIVTVHTEFETAGFNIYPTSYGTYAANIITEDNTLATISLADVNGRIVNEVNASLTKGINLIEVYNRPLLSGIYIANLLLNNKQITTKILIH